MAQRKKPTPMPTRDPAERSKDFAEVARGYTREMAIEEANRCLQCKTPTCEQGCPVGINIKGFIKHLHEENFEKALETIEKSNTLPAVCGRVCPQEKQCESRCVLAKTGKPIAIGRLERFLGDYGGKKEQEQK